MPEIPMKQALAEHGLRAEFRGMPAMILPVTEEIARTVDFSAAPVAVAPGQVLVSWIEEGKRRGHVLNADARNDLVVLVRREDGTDARVASPTVWDGAIALLDLRARARENAAAVAKENAEAARVHAAAVERGERPDPVEPRRPEFAEAAFAALPRFVDLARDMAQAVREDRLADIRVRADADAFTAKLQRKISVEVTAEEKAAIDEARKIRAEIAVLAPGHADAVPGLAPARYAGDGKAARDLVATLPRDERGLAAAQSSVLARHVDATLYQRLFAVATTTPAQRLVAMPLSHEGMRGIAQELARHENREQGPAVIARMAAVTRDGMPGYEWEGRLYSKDGADVLLMRDAYAAYAYAWDSASRIDEMDVAAALQGRYRPEDVPAEGDLERLRAVLGDLRHDNGADIDFDFDAPARAPAADLDDEDDENDEECEGPRF